MVQIILIIGGIVIFSLFAQFFVREHYEYKKAMSEYFGEYTNQYLKDRKAIREAHNKYIVKQLSQLNNDNGIEKPLVIPSIDIVDIHK